MHRNIISVAHSPVICEEIKTIGPWMKAMRKTPVILENSEERLPPPLRKWLVLGVVDMGLRVEIHAIA